MLSRNLLYLGFFLVPFENLSIAPSSGWPAIAPLIFLLVAVLNIKKIQFSKKEFVIIFGLTLWSSVGWQSSFFLTDGNRFFFRDVTGALVPLLLGYAFYKVLELAISDRDLLKCGINYFILGSVLSFVASITILIFGFLLKVPAFLGVMDMVLKRNSELSRFSFLFAEPSFVSVHIIGFLVPLMYISKISNFEDQFSRLTWVLIVYLAIGLIFMDSARFYIDIIFLLLIVVIFYVTGSYRRFSYFKVIPFLLLMGPPILLVISFPEMMEVLTLGRVDLDNDFIGVIGSDASLASRYFRSDAVVSSIISQNILLFTGVGFGNVGLLVDLGYDEALTRFTSSYMKELFDIYYFGNGSNVYNMYVRLLGEFGIVITSLILLLLYDRRYVFLYVIACWCYLQFDSYAFYTIWIYAAVRSSLVGFNRKDLSICD